MHHIPNVLTMLRIALVVPTAWFLWQERLVEACVLMAVAGASDALDGALARRFNWMSRLGAVLDPLADKLLVAVIFVVFTVQGHLPLWVAVIVLVRDFVIMGGAAVYRLLFKRIDIAPTFVSKANTAMQIITLLLLMVALLDLAEISAAATAMVDPYCFIILAVLGVSSGIDYVITWSRKAFGSGAPQRPSRNGAGPGELG